MVTTTRKTAYEQRLADFADSRIFHEVGACGTGYELLGQRCEACGSPAVKHFRMLEDISGARYFVGVECYMHLRKASSEWPQVKEHGRAFELWVQENEKLCRFLHTWQCLEIYLQQNSEDKTG